MYTYVHISYCTLQCIHMYIYIILYTTMYTYVHIIILFRLRNAQDQLIHLEHEEDRLNKVLDEDEAQINKIAELIAVVEM